MTRHAKDMLLRTAQDGITTLDSLLATKQPDAGFTLPTFPLPPEGQFTVFPTSESASGQSASASGLGSTFQAIAPPVLEMLQEARLRREANRAANVALVQALSTLAPQAVPQGAEFFPGFEPGGLADVLANIITGGEGSRGVIAESSRRPGQVRIPTELLQQDREPGLGVEFPATLQLALQILNALRIIQTGKNVSASVSGGTSKSTGQQVIFPAAKAITSEDIFPPGTSGGLDPTSFGPFPNFGQ